MAEAVVSIVVGRLTDLLTEESQLLHRVRDEIEQVVTELTRIKTFLPDADSRIHEPKVRTLVADVRELAYDAEHVVETFLVKSSAKTIQWRNTNKFPRKIKDIHKKMSLLFDRFRDCNIKSTLESPSSSSGTPKILKRFYSYATPEPELVVGFDQHVDLLIEHLVNESADCYQLVSICGMGGLGKTTLARKIYNHPIIRACFAGLAWVSISQKWNTKFVLQRILICLVPEKKNEIITWKDDKLVENLLQIQQCKKCLIVLDDMWSTDAWDSLKAAFPAEKSVSKLMLTSRIVHVAEHVDANGFIYRPECLSEEQSWELLKLKALPRGGDSLDITRDVKRMEELGREMVGNCGGLPLAIVVLGGILVTKPSLIEWEKVYNDSLLSLKSGEGLESQRELFENLIWSYNDLPPQLKPCFLYLGKFGENEWIKTNTLYQLWIAEGMVLSSDKREGETMMQVAESYMEELVHRSLVQVRVNDVESSPTKFKSCSLHDLMRDLSRYQTKLEDFFEVIDLREGNGFYQKKKKIFFFNLINRSAGFTSSYNSRQFVVQFDDRYTNTKANSYFVKKIDQQRCRSMILVNKSETGRELPQVLSLHVPRFRFLRVISLERVKSDTPIVSFKLGSVLGSLVYLRYLSLKNTNFIIFPSIQKLVLLQTLNLDTYEDISFPPSLSVNILVKLRHLRHLYLPSWKSNRLEKNFKLRFDGLSRLETLENFNTNWCVVEDLPKLINLQRLTINTSDYDVEEMMKSLGAMVGSSYSCLGYLALSIFSKSLAFPNGTDTLRQLFWDGKLFNLQKLTVVGQLPDMAQIFDQKLLNSLAKVSLVRITSLKLCFSSLEEDPMPVLEKIPTLRELHLVETYVGMEMVCSANGFPKLIFLSLYDLPNIVKWRVDEGSMRCLSNLYIAFCPKLEELPEGLRFLNSLERLRLHSLSTDLIDRIRAVNGEQGPDFYKVAHVPDLSIISD